MIEAVVIVAGVLMPPPEFERPSEVQVTIRHFPAAHVDQVCRIYPRACRDAEREVRRLYPSWRTGLYGYPAASRHR